VKRVTASEVAVEDDRSLAALWAEWEREGREFWQEMDALVGMLEDVLQA
jgi:hypothetical protein